MSFLSKFIDQYAWSGVVRGIRAIDGKVPAMNTEKVQDKLAENIEILARQMSQYAQRPDKIPAEMIAAALTAGYCAAELRHRERPRRT